MTDLTLGHLKSVIEYDVDSGSFVWLRNRNSKLIGAFAGYVDANGYRVIQVSGRPYKAHRLAWFYMTGENPSQYIDHINGDKADNRFANLRLATNSQNQANRGAPKNNKTGHKGIWFDPERQKWVAGIWLNGERQTLGRFEAKEAAVEAYQLAAKSLFGEYAGDVDCSRELQRAYPDNSSAISHPSLTHEYLLSVLRYSPSTGMFTWLKNRQGHIRKGDVAGTIEWTGYRGIKVRGRLYRAHRLAWFYVHGVWPDGEVDHINGKPDDNRMANLRVVDRSQNSQNTRAHRDSRTGIKGVSYDARCPNRPWSAKIKANGQFVYIGSFHTAEQAAEAYADAANEAFGNYSVVNRPLET